MAIYIAAAPSIIAILVKFTILYFFANSNMSRKFLWLIAIFSVNNIAELLLFFGTQQGMNPEQAMAIYYVSIIFAMFFTCVYAVDLAKLKMLRVMLWFFGCLYLITSLLIVATDKIISGAIPLNHGYTAINGEHYFVFSMISIFTILLVVSSLIIGYKKSNCHKTQIQCGWSLIALSSLIIISISVVILMALGKEVNALTVIPIGTTLFVLISLITETEHGMTDVRAFLPTTQENKAVIKIANISAKYTMEELSHHEATNEINRVMVEYKIQKEDNNMSKAAKSMGMARPTLYNLANRFNINFKKYEK